ncbi:hypothetical protein HYALB_00011186 [Hymenoscyphus albidus]|uniref:Rad50/SbcC-type AAA domain-containing protein n=1 Tax=Hymenoscyphus albidus TaxID=595503 RepID=A0A9N9LUZ6_9HELO|nr:hypothetical protein HYALB_00011186 [Hymenoscyphus albidus]
MQTIIESLKYATTGELPPGAKTTGAFIHDPKICGESEVLGQVKLQFRDAKHSRLVITRSMQASIKKGGARSQKQIDCNLLMVRDEERTNLSKRVAEMDSVIPRYLGVSKAILENVIFCHQDESLWPMSEPSVLKKKFDEIFEAQKYTSAIDNLKLLRKHQVEELKKLKIEEEHLKQEKERGARLESKCTQLHTDLESLRDQHDVLVLQIEDASKVQQEKDRSFTKARETVGELVSTRGQAQYTKKNVDELKANMKEHTEADEWLQQTLAQYDERMAELNQAKDNYVRQYTEVGQSIKRATKQMSQKQSEKGQLIAEKSSYENQIISRQQLVKVSARDHSMRGYDGEIDDDRVREFVNKIEKLSREKDRELEKIRKQMDEERQAKQDVLTTLETKRSSRMGEKTNARQTITNNEKKMAAGQQKMNSISMDEGSYAALGVSDREIQQRLESLRSNYDAADWDKKIRKEETEQRELGAEQTRLRSELMKSHQQAEAQAQFQLVKKELKDRERTLDTMQSTYRDQLSAVIGPNWTVDSLEERFEVAASKRANIVSDAKKKQEELSRELSSVEYKLKTSRDSLKQKTDDIRRFSTAVMNSIPDENGNPLSSIEEYPVELAELERLRNEQQVALDSGDHLKDFFDNGLKHIEGRNSCILCQREFTSGSEKSNASQAIKARIHKIEQSAKQESLEVIEADLEKANAVRQQYDAYKTLLEVDVPSLKTEIQKTESEKKLLVERLEKQDLVVADAVASQRDLDSLVKPVANITLTKNEIAKYEAESARLASQQSISGSTLNADELDQQMNTCEDRIRAVNARINKLRSDKEQASSSINLLETEKAGISQNLSSAKHQLERKQSLLDEIKELRDSTAKLRALMQEADAEIESLGPEVAKAKAAFDEVQNRGRSKEKEVQNDKTKVAETVHKFKVIEESINKYIEHDGAGKLTSCERAITRVEQEKEGFEAEQQELTKKAKAIEQQTADSESTRKSINENLRYRAGLKELRKLQRKIQELEARNVEEDYQQLQIEADEATKYHQDLVARRGPIAGEITARDAELTGCLEEYEKEYKNAPERFREAHLKVELTKAAVDDMAKYGEALDAAIMKYHSMKMEEINQIAGELWQRTYQGTDVDGIMIRSENENANSKRNYNYRVVMVKGDVEMDMRGRCSAGQKVLASIIIRLALAECFGANCGVIALDEPTTNLDTDNIKALASSLHAIIQSRRHQANFQLIIITHDEAFLRDMNCSDFIESYFRVSRNALQKSQIETCALSNFM